MQEVATLLYSPDGHITPHGQRDGKTNRNGVQDLCEEHVHQQIHGPGVAQILLACKGRVTATLGYLFSCCLPGFMYIY